MEIVLRAVAVYLFLWLATKAMGKRELAQMSAFELILLVILGDLIQQSVTQEDRSIVGGFIAVSTLVVLITGMSWLTYRSNAARNVLEGSPVVVLRDGRLLPTALKFERVTFDELQDAAREQGIDDLSGVRLGILEADGRFSFLLQERPRRQQRTKGEADLA
jgi:uncharacterized membrane protein YcaP (DUF421 family)